MDLPATPRRAGKPAPPCAAPNRERLPRLPANRTRTASGPRPRRTPSSRSRRRCRDHAARDSASQANPAVKVENQRPTPVRNRPRCLRSDGLATCPTAAASGAGRWRPRRPPRPLPRRSSPAGLRMTHPGIHRTFRPRPAPRESTPATRGFWDGSAACRIQARAVRAAAETARQLPKRLPVRASSPLGGLHRGTEAPRSRRANGGKARGIVLRHLKNRIRQETCDPLLWRSDSAGPTGTRASTRFSGGVACSRDPCSSAA